MLKVQSEPCSGGAVIRGGTDPYKFGWSKWNRLAKDMSHAMQGPCHIDRQAYQSHLGRSEPGTYHRWTIVLGMHVDLLVPEQAINHWHANKFSYSPCRAEST